MRRLALALLFPLLFSLPTAFIACATGNNNSTGPHVDPGSGGGGNTSDPPDAAAPDSGPSDDGGFDFPDAEPDAPIITADAACASAVQEATTTQLPVDIIWIVDNSSSMQPAIAEVKEGLNSFAALIESKSLDYRVIMLSLRGATSPVQISGSNRYPICIPAPLAGPDCGNGARFFQSSIDIRSTQPLEHFLGTLGQTPGYAEGEAKGGEPWADKLRPEATKTIVVVTDDNARLSATEFETFPGGKNPFNSLTLPPGILDPSYGGLFNGYVFSGIYGWGSENDPGVTCTYQDGTSPPSPGPTYTTLVKKTGGVRAKLCDASAAWDPFFEAVAQAVAETSKLSCNLAIPKPQEGELDPDAINVQIVANDVPTILVKVANAEGCGPAGGWYYDDDAAPTEVLLCPTSCDAAQDAVGLGKTGRIEVLFGCATIVQ